MSSNRLPAAQGKHDTMVGVAYQRLIANGYVYVKADHIGGPQPEQICWERGECHIPDVEGSKNGSKVVVEVETEDSLSCMHAREQCRLFGTWASQYRHEFVLAVPAGYEVAGKRLLLEAGVPQHQVVGI